MEVSESAKSATEVLNSNISISKQIQNTNELLNFVVVNLIWLIVFGMVVLLGLLIFLIVKNKKDSKKAVLESFETVFGSEGSELKKLFSDMSEVKSEILKLNLLVDSKEKDKMFFEHMVNENDSFKKILKEWILDLEKNNKQLYNDINKNVSRYYSESKDFLELLKNDEIGLSSGIQKLLLTFNKEIGEKISTIDCNLNEMIFNIGKKFYENNKSTLQEIQKTMEQINNMYNMIEKGKTFDDDELFEIIFSNSSMIVFKIQIAIMTAISYPSSEVDQNKKILFSNLGAIFNNAILNSRNRLKVQDKRLQSTLNTVDTILKELEKRIVEKLNNYFNTDKHNEIEIMRTLRAISKICDNSITEIETAIAAFYK